MTTTPAQSGGRTVRTPVDLKRRMADSGGSSAMLIVLTVLSMLVAGAAITGVVVLASSAVAVAGSSAGVGYLVLPGLALSRLAPVLAGLAHLFVLDLRDPSSGGGLFDSRPAFEERLRRLRDLIPSGSGA